MVAAIVLAGAALLLSAQTAVPPPRPPACTSPEHRQFDFWVGSWQVYRTGTDQQVARSLVERLYDGCAIRENWMPRRGAGGGSLNSYRPDEERWRQTWVDSANGWVEFSGGVAGEAMVLSGLWRGINGPGTEALVRMTYSRQPNGSVRQLGEASSDGGSTWAPAFDFTYRPAAAE